MIDFRYHLVSIVAIFMALAVGIALGSGPLKDPIDAFLDDQTSQVVKDKQELQDRVIALEGDLEAFEEFATAVEPAVLAATLSGRSVAVVVLPGAEPDDVDGVEEALKLADARLTQTVEITDDWVDPKRQAVLERVAEGLATSSQRADDLGGAALAAEVLAAALVTDEPRLLGRPSSAAQAVMTGLSEVDLVSYDDTAEWRLAGAVVVVSAPPITDVEAAERTAQALLPLAEALDTRGLGTVVGGPSGSAGPGGFVAAVRDSAAADIVSTVDNVDSSVGLIGVPLALQRELAGETGHYGLGEGADAVIPPPLAAEGAP